MDTAGMGAFQMGDVKDSTVMVGHRNCTVAEARRRRSADPEVDWINFPRLNYREDPYNYYIEFALREWEKALGYRLREEDVVVERGNKREVKTSHVTADLKIFLKDGKGGWVDLDYPINLQKNAKLEEFEYTVSDGVLTIIVPKGGKYAQPLGRDKDKDKGKGKAVDPSMAEGTSTDYLKRKRTTTL